MANVNSVSSSSSTSSLYGNRNILSGLASGLDTESMIENSIKGYQTKISQLEQEQTKVEWKQDAYRTYIDSLNDFMKKYGSSTSKTDLSSASFYTGAQSTSVLGDNASKVTATGKTNSDIEIWAATKGTAARYVLSADALGGGSATGLSGGLDWGATNDLPAKTSLAEQLSGKTITVGGVELTIPKLTDAADDDDALDTMLTWFTDKLSGTGISVEISGDGLSFSRADGTGVSVEYGEGVKEMTDGSGTTTLLGDVETKISTTGSLSWALTGDAAYTDTQTLADYLAGKTISLSVSGRAEPYELTLPSLRDGSSADLDGGLVRSLQSQLDRENAGIDVSIDSITGELSFTKQGAGSTISGIALGSYLDSALTAQSSPPKTATAVTLDLGDTTSQKLAERLSGTTLTVGGVHQITLPDVSLSGNKTDALKEDIQRQLNSLSGCNVSVDVKGGKLVFTDRDAPDTPVSVSFSADTGTGVSSSSTASKHEQTMTIDLSDKEVLSLSEYLNGKTIKVDGHPLTIGDFSDSDALAADLESQLVGKAANTVYHVEASGGAISFSKTVTKTNAEFTPTSGPDGYTWDRDNREWTKTDTVDYDPDTHGHPGDYDKYDASTGEWYKEVHHTSTEQEDPDFQLGEDGQWHKTTKEKFEGSFTPTAPDGYGFTAADWTGAGWSKTTTQDYLASHGDGFTWDDDEGKWTKTTDVTGKINGLGTGTTVGQAISGNDSSSITLTWNNNLPQDAFAYLKDKSINVDGTTISFSGLSATTSASALQTYIQGKVSSLITVQVQGNDTDGYSLKFTKSGGAISALTSDDDRGETFKSFGSDSLVSEATTDISLDWDDTDASEQDVAGYLKNKTITVDGKSRKLFDITAADTADADSLAAYLGRKFSDVDVEVSDDGKILFSKNGSDVTVDLGAADSVFKSTASVTASSSATVTVPVWNAPVQTQTLGEYLNGRTITVAGKEITFDGFGRDSADRIYDSEQDLNFALNSSDGLLTYLNERLKGTGVTASIDDSSGSELLQFTGSDGKAVEADLSSISGAVGSVTSVSSFAPASGQSWTDEDVDTTEAETLASRLMGVEIDVTYGSGASATTRTLTISALDTTSTADQTQTLLDDLNSQLRGTGVTAGVVDGQLRFNGATAVDDSELRDVGVSASASTALDLNTKMSAFSDLDGLSAMSIGGKTITFSSDTTLSELFSKINSDTDLSVSYSRITGEIVFAAKEAGAGEIEMDAAAQALFGGGTHTAGTDSVLEATINGRDVTLTAASNQFSLDGLTVTLKDSFDTADDQDPLTFQTSADTDKIVSAVKSYVDDYNALVKSLYSALTTRPNTRSNGSGYEPLTDEDKSDMSESAVKAYEEKAKAGLLFGDNDLRGLFNGLRSAFSPVVSSYKIDEDGKQVAMTAAEKADALEKVKKMQQAMKDIGLGTEYADGVTTLKIDEDKLRDALEKNGTDVVKDVFANSSGYKARDGLTGRIQAVMEKYADTSIANTGILVKKAGTTLSSTSLLSNELLKQINKIQDQIDTWNTKMSAKIDYYTKQFTLLEQLMNQMNAQSSSLAGMLGG